MLAGALAEPLFGRARLLTSEQIARSGVPLSDLTLRPHSCSQQLHRPNQWSIALNDTGVGILTDSCLDVVPASPALALIRC